MHHSGSIGGPSLAQLERLGVAVPARSVAVAMPAPFAAAWQVSQWNPGGIKMSYPDRGLPVATLDKTPAQIFDLFSTARSAPANTYYVSPTGNDTTGTGASGATWRSIHKAVTAANATGLPARVYVAAGDYPKNNNPSYNGTVRPSVDIAFIATGRVTTGTYDDIFGATFDTTYTNCSKVALTSVQRVIDYARLDERGFYPDLLRVSSLDLCNRTPDSWYTDGTTMYVNRRDGQLIATANTKMLRGGGGVFLTWNPVSIYVGTSDPAASFHCLGGTDTTGCFVYAPSTVNGTRAVVVENSTFRNAGGSISGGSGADGVYINSLNGLALFSGCDASDNARDGFSFWRTVTGAKTHGVLVNCRGIVMGPVGGVGTAGACNGLTGHNDTVIADFAGEYGLTGGGVVGNIGDTFMLLVGTKMDSDYGDFVSGGVTHPGAVKMKTNSLCWMDRCEVKLAPGTYSFYTDGTSAIYTRNMPPRRTPDAGTGIYGTW